MFKKQWKYSGVCVMKRKFNPKQMHSLLYFRTYELIRPTLLLSDPELINIILVKEFHKFSDHRVRNIVITN